MVGNTRSLVMLIVLCSAEVNAQIHVIDTPMSPPEWALLERAVLETSGDACQEFFDRYFDERGFLLCVERWGGDDGPDDAIENCNDWPLLYALGADSKVKKLVQKAWEGHLRQFTLAKTVQVPFARDGMYYKEFPVMMDWLHNGEGLAVFDLMGLGDPDHPLFESRVRRYAGFYMNEDPQAPNYDPKHKIIKSLFNGSRGPLLRRATGLDWAGDPIEVENRFRPGHGERTYQEMVDHFKDYNDIVGDHPSNLLATSLAFNAFALTGETKYKEWLLEYARAWIDRMHDNDGIIPTNIGLDGTIGGATDGKWWGGVYGWGFSVKVPQTGALAHRSTFQLGFVGFMNAFGLTNDRDFLTPWRAMLENVNSHSKRVDGVTLYPQKFGDDGWYNFTRQPFAPFARELFFLTLDPVDLKWIQADPWIQFLRGENPNYPVQAFRSDLTTMRDRIAAMRRDLSTPDTRLSDDTMKYNPASIRSLVPLVMGGPHPGYRGSPLFCSVRYFDAENRRPGFPMDVAALVRSIAPDSTTIELVNVSPVHPREVILMAGAYGEHQIVGLEHAQEKLKLNSSHVRVRLEPGCGQRITLRVKRFANPPTMAFPWDRN